MDVSYLTKEVLSFKLSLEEAAVERFRLRQGVSTESTPRAANWTAHTYMRFAHALGEDSVKETFLRCHDTLDQTEFDARNSEERPPTFAEACADKFNDTAFAPTLFGLPSLHEEFANPIVLVFEEATGPISQDQVKTRFADVKTKLALVRTVRRNCCHNLTTSDKF